MGASTTTQAGQYAGMTPEALLQECERLQRLTTGQARLLGQLKTASVDMITDFSGVILAHIGQDAAEVSRRLDAIVNKNVIIVPKAGACH